MPYTRRSTWPDDDDRDDYVIRCEGLDVGRVYLTRVPAGDRWLWTIFMNGHVPKVEDVPIAAWRSRSMKPPPSSNEAMSGCARRRGCRNRSDNPHSQRQGWPVKSDQGGGPSAKMQRGR